MWNTRTPANFLLGSTFLWMVAAPVVANAADSSELACRRAIVTGLTQWTNETFRARLGCQSEVASGILGAGTDCVSGAGSTQLEAELAKSDSALRGRLEAACGDANWGLLSYPGPCAATTEGPFDAAALAACISVVGGEAVSDLFRIWYPAILDQARGAAGDCVRTVPKRASAMVLAEARLRLGCLLTEEASGGGDLDCRAQLPPYSTGTGDPVLDAKIGRAQRLWLARSPRSCARADFASLGYGDHCPNPQDSGSGLLDFSACVFHTNRLAVPRVLDLAFPSTPVCGNGIHQEGEACDNGAGNSDTKPDACRLDCTLPYCGDGVTDPSNEEQCDDGNTDDLDGCNATCGLEICGDGITNNLPHEGCDDHNANSHDMCTNTCTVAVCGDGIVCSDASCTTGPGGGPEQCDQGAGNSATGICHTDCSGFSKVCSLTIGVTNTVKLGALTYEMSYAGASGEMAGTGGKVQCTSTVTGGLQSFFDNDASRFVKESVIVDAGLQTPASVAKCNFATNAAAPAPGTFTFTIDAASDPDFNNVNVTMAVTNVDCQ